MTPLVVVVGYGNPYLSDDGLGWHVAGKLKHLEENYRPEMLRILQLIQLGPELAELLSQSDLVLFVDAEEGLNPGAISRTVVQPSQLTSAHSHQLSPQHLFYLCQELYGEVPQGWLHTAGGSKWDHGSEMSEEMHRAYIQLVAVVSDEIKDFFGVGSA